jgi:hypothetical protein
VSITSSGAASWPVQHAPAPHFHQTMSTHIFRLQPGDIIKFDGEPCRVVRVSESAAIIAVRTPARTITPRFGPPVTIQPSPKLVRISPNSEIPILNRSVL